MIEKVNKNKFGVIEYLIEDMEDLKNLPKKDTDNTSYAIMRKGNEKLIYLYSSSAKEWVLINEDLSSIKSSLDNIIRKSFISVSDFGALGKSEDYTEEFKKAIEYVKNNNLNLYIPIGYYNISETLIIPSSVSIIGESRVRTVINFNNSTDNLFKFSDGAIFNTIENLAIYGVHDYTKQAEIITNNAIHGSSVSHLTIKNVDIRKFGGSAIVINQTDGMSTSIGVNIENCYIKNNCGDSIKIEQTHGVRIKGGACELNRGWNIYLGNECMETIISDINMNTGVNSLKGSICSTSNSMYLDNLILENIHLEANGAFTNTSTYMVEINSSNYTLKHCYFRTSKTNSLGGIKCTNTNGEIYMCTFRGMETGIKIIQTSHSKTLDIIKPSFEGVTTEVDGTGCNRYTLLTIPQLTTQSIPFDFILTKTFAVRPPRERQRLYGAYVLVKSDCSEISFNPSVLSIYSDSSLTNNIYTSPTNAFKKSMGSLINLNLPTNQEFKMLYVNKATVPSSDRVDFELILEWC